MPAPSPPTAAAPADPRIPAVLRDALDEDLDPQFPDLDGFDLGNVDLTFPEARTLTVLRGRLRSCDIAIDEEATIDAQDAQFVDVDLSGGRFEGLSRVSFVRCRLTGADFGEARLRDVRFADCAMDLTSMRSTTLERIAITGGRIDELDLCSARLTDGSFADVTLTGLALDGTRFERVDLTEADLSAVTDVRDLKGSIISPTQAVSLAVRLAKVAGLHVATTPD